MFLEHWNFTWLTVCLATVQFLFEWELRVGNWLCCRLGECLQCWKAWRYHRQARTMSDLTMPIISQKCFSECLRTVLLLTSLQREKLVTPNLWNGCSDIELNRCCRGVFSIWTMQLNVLCRPHIWESMFTQPESLDACLLGRNGKSLADYMEKCMLMCTSSHFSLIFFLGVCRGETFTKWWCNTDYFNQ